MAKHVRHQKLPLDQFRYWFNNLRKEKNVRNTATGFDIATNYVINKLKELGANPRQIARFKYLINKAPIKGGLRFNAYCGD